VTDISRRSVVALGLGAIAASAASTVANTQQAVAPRTGPTDKQGRFAGQVALITGGTSGIGKVTAIALAREGAKVAFCGRREELGKGAQREIESLGAEAMFMRADVTDEEQVRAFVDATAKRWGRVDICLNNAGIDRPNAPLHETETNLFDEVIDVNLRGAFFTLKHVAGQMLRQQPGGGHIVNVASVGGHRGYAGIIAYSASKAAVLSMTRTAASELSDKNIRVNSVSPGPVVTAMLERAQRDWGLPGLEAFAAGAAVKRNAMPEEIARAVMWLCGPEASYVAGADMLIDGGYLLK
jgi:NAD(P)-dependent dehydrogenase (short-subunit alcohol dehydrogenase family)